MSLCDTVLDGWSSCKAGSFRWTQPLVAKTISEKPAANASTPVTTQVAWSGVPDVWHSVNYMLWHSTTESWWSPALLTAKEAEKAYLVIFCPETSRIRWGVHMRLYRSYIKHARLTKASTFSTCVINVCLFAFFAQPLRNSTPLANRANLSRQKGCE